MKKRTTSHECRVKDAALFTGSTAVNRRVVFYDISRHLPLFMRTLEISYVSVDTYTMLL